jgi:hypothetical protein
MAAILFRPGHTDPAAPDHRAGEVAVEITAGEAHQVLVSPDEITHFGTQGHCFGRQFDGIETEHRRCHGRFSTSSC